MSYRLTTVILVVAVVLISCMARRTRQFVPVPEYADVEVSAGGWMLSPPRVVAFKDVIKVDDIKDTTMFWISIEAKHPKSKGLPVESDLRIDSIMVSFVGFDSSYWRQPTRVAPFGLDNWKFAHKAFDLFGNQGVVIPMNVDSIYIDFQAVVREADSSVIEYPVHFVLAREEKSLAVPLLRQ